MKAAVATGKALHAALGGPEAGGNALANLSATPTISSAGLAVPASAAGAGSLGATATTAAETLEAGDSAGALGSWSGMDYAKTTGTGDAKVTNEARVYTNKGPGKRVSFANAGITVFTGDTAGDDRKGYVTLDEADTTTLGRIRGAAFERSGTQTYEPASEADAVYLSGTFAGAPGRYRCEGATCSVTNDGKDGPTSLVGTWHFKPDAGVNAMTQQPDAIYLYYGWWVNKDKDGGPTAASAFAGIVEPASPDDLADADLTVAALTGSATYAGHAAGKYAINNVLDGTGHGGHFVADAMLTAKFGGTTQPGTGNEFGVTGTIDNFRLNDGSEDPGWSVQLKRSSAFTTTGGITGPAQVDGADVATVWSINGNKAPASGTWSGTMYDELPGNAPDGDGSNLPTTVTGTFYSEFSTIGRMVGAFGADKQD